MVRIEISDSLTWKYFSQLLKRNGLKEPNSLLRIRLGFDLGVGTALITRFAFPEGITSACKEACSK